MAEEDEFNALSKELESIKKTLRTNTIQLRQMVEELRRVLPTLKNPRNLGEKIQEISFMLADPQGVRENATDINFQRLLPNTLQEPKERDPAEKFDRQQEMMDLASDEIHDNKPTELVTACCEAKNLVLGSVKSTTPEDEEVVELDNNSDNLVSSKKDSGKDRAVTSVQRLQEHNDVDKKPFSRKPINQFIPWISAQQGNFCSSQPSMYSNQFLKEWEQLLTLENIGERIVLLAQDRVWNGILNLKLEKGLSEEEIEMVLLDVMNNVMVGNDVVGGAVNSRILEYAIQDFKEGMEVYGSKVEPQALTIETSVCNEVAYLNRNVILAEDSDSVKSAAVRTTLFSKHFVTTWPFIDKDDDTLRFNCGLTMSPLDLGVLFSYRDFLVLVLVWKRYKDVKVCSSTIIVQRRNLNMHDVWTSRLNFYCCLSYGPSGDVAESIISKVIQDGALEFIKGCHDNQLLIAFVKTEVRDLFCGVIGDFGRELTRCNYEGGLYVLEMAQVYIKQADFVCEMINKVNGDTSYVRLKEKILEICECDCILGSLNCCFKIKKWPQEPLPPPEPPPPWVGLYPCLRSPQASSNTNDLIKVPISISRKLLAQQIKRLCIKYKVNVQFLHAFPKICDEDAKILIPKLQKSVLEELKTHNTAGRMCIIQAATIKCMDFLLTTMLEKVEGMEDLKTGGHLTIFILTLSILEDKDYLKGTVL